MTDREIYKKEGEQMPRVAKEKSKHEKPRPTKSKLKSKKAKGVNIR